MTGKAPLTAKECAEYLGIPPSTWYSYVNRPAKRNPAPKPSGWVEGVRVWQFEAVRDYAEKRRRNTKRVVRDRADDARAFLAEGLSYAQVAQRMSVSEPTVYAWVPVAESPSARVAQLLRDGMSYRRIAHELKLTERQVRAIAPDSRHSAAPRTTPPAV